MWEEIAAAVIFLTKLVKKNQNLSEEQVEEFSKRLSSILGDRFKNHWYQDDPQKGQAYRCIRINETVTRDPVIEQAASASGILYGDLNMPTELTVWVDPKEVCCRFGENKGSWCTLFKEGQEAENIDSVVIKNVLTRPQMQRNRPIEVTRSNQRSGSTSPPSTVPVRGYRSSLNSNTSNGSFRNFNHNHNNNQMKFKHFNQNKFHQPPPPPPNHHSSSPTFSNGGKFVHSPGKPFKMQSHFQQRLSTSRNDRFHWVRGADLVKA